MSFIRGIWSSPLGLFEIHPLQITSQNLKHCTGLHVHHATSLLLGLVARLALQTDCRSILGPLWLPPQDTSVVFWCDSSHTQLQDFWMAGICFLWTSGWNQFCDAEEGEAIWSCSEQENRHVENYRWDKTVKSSKKLNFLFSEHSFDTLYASGRKEWARNWQVNEQADFWPKRPTL